MAAPGGLMSMAGSHGVKIVMPTVVEKKAESVSRTAEQEQKQKQKQKRLHPCDDIDRLFRKIKIAKDYYETFPSRHPSKRWPGTWGDTELQLPDWLVIIARRGYCAGFNATDGCSYGEDCFLEWKCMICYDDNSNNHGAMSVRLRTPGVHPDDEDAADLYVCPTVRAMAHAGYIVENDILHVILQHIAAAEASDSDDEEEEKDE